MRLIGVHGKARSGKDVFCKILTKTYGFEQLAFAAKVKEFAIKYFGCTEEEVHEKKTKASRQILQGLGECVRNFIPIYQQLTDEERNEHTEIQLKTKIKKAAFPKWVELAASSYFFIDPEFVHRKRKYNIQVLTGIHNMFTEKEKEFLEVSQREPEKIWINYIKRELKEDKVYVISDIRYTNEKEFVENNGKVVKITRTDKPNIEANAEHVSEVSLDNDVKWDFSIYNEHKSGWQESLVLYGANMVRKFMSQGFFTPEDIAKFKINLQPH